jgi:spermidine synthase
LIVLYPFVEYAPYAAHVIRALFASNAPSFYAYHLAIFFAILAIALIPLALSGALLPLLFHHLRDRVGELGEMAGRLYSWTTVGSLLGALIGGYAIFFWLDLHHAYRIAVLASGVTAAILTRLTLPKFGRVAWIGLATLVLALLSQPAWDGQRLALGIFRHHTAMDESFDGPEAFYEFYMRARLGKTGFVPFYDDDPSMSVAVIAAPLPNGYMGLSIVNNGKVDGMIPGDNQTTGLLALLPTLFSKHAERAFVIGYGTGMTVGELAALDSMEEVVVAEISSAVIEAAPIFEKGNRGASTNPKTRLLRADAYRALLRSDDQYDIIVSEPSNPWVTGVEMLYSFEFLEAARGQLREGGVYAQWFHSYETNSESVELVLNTYRQVFDHVAVWQTGVDFILLGFKDATTARNLDLVAQRFSRPDIRAQLGAIGFESLPQLLVHEMIPVGVLHEAELPGRVHTLSHPLLSHVAAQGFFSGGDGKLPATLHTRAAIAGAENSLLRRYAARVGGALPAQERAAVIREACGLSRPICVSLAAEWLRDYPNAPELEQLLADLRKNPGLESDLDPERLGQIAQLFDVRSLPNAAHGFESADSWASLFHRHYTHAAPFDGRALVSIWAHCAGDDRCRSGAARDRGLGIPHSASTQPRKPARPVALR